MTTYFEVFNQGFQAHEAEAVRELVTKIDVFKDKMNSLATDHPSWQVSLEKLAQQRLRSSSSLKRGDVQAWFEANQWVQDKIALDLAPAWSDVCELNSRLTGVEIQNVVRSEEIYVGPYQACKVQHLESELYNFKEVYLSNRSQHHPLVHAALAQYVLVSLHPFKDGNGRTSVILADWILALADYLPQSFTSKADGVVMYQYGRPTVITPGKAVVRVLNNVLNSYRCFEA